MRRYKARGEEKESIQQGLDAFLNHRVLRNEIEWTMCNNEDSWNAGGNTKKGRLQIYQGIGRSSHLLVLNLAAKTVNAKTKK